MSRRALLRRLLYVVQWLGFLSFVSLVAVFSLTGNMLEVPQAAYGLSGEGFVEKYGMRPVLLILFVAACAIDAICLVLGRFARLFHYPVPIDMHNIEVQYLLSKMMLSVIQFVSTVYFTFLMVQIFEMQIRFRSPSFALLSAVAVLLVVLDIAVYLYLAKKNR